MTAATMRMALTDLEQSFGERPLFRQGGIIREYKSVGRIQGESITAFVRRFRPLERKAGWESGAWVSWGAQGDQTIWWTSTWWTGYVPAFVGRWKPVQDATCAGCHKDPVPCRYVHHWTPQQAVEEEFGLSQQAPDQIYEDKVFLACRCRGLGWWWWWWWWWMVLWECRGLHDWGALWAGEWPGHWGRAHARGHHLRRGELRWRCQRWDCCWQFSQLPRCRFVGGGGSADCDEQKVGWAHQVQGILQAGEVQGQVQWQRQEPQRFKGFAPGQELWEGQVKGQRQRKAESNSNLTMQKEAIDKSLCLGCMQPGHWLRDCPHTSPYAAQLTTAGAVLDPDGHVLDNWMVSCVSDAATLGGKGTDLSEFAVNPNHELDPNIPVKNVKFFWGECGSHWIWHFWG